MKNSYKKILLGYDNFISTRDKVLEMKPDKIGLPNHYTEAVIERNDVFNNLVSVLVKEYNLACPKVRTWQENINNEIIELVLALNKANEIEVNKRMSL